MQRVWGKRPDEAELEWFYERNPVRPASVLLAEEDDRVVATVGISFQQGGDVGQAFDLATDPAYQGRGIFSELQAANEARARDAGAKLLFTVPTAASARILTARLAWRPLPSLRVWARPWLPVRARGPRVERFGDAWLDWRFADAPREYALFADRTVVGRRGRLRYVAAGGAHAPGGIAMLALPPSDQHGRYLRAGFVPTPKAYTLLAKSLDGSPLPRLLDLQLGDLDFF
jgi:GNAT superfamily N-acetyltransferase